MKKILSLVALVSSNLCWAGGGGVIHTLNVINKAMLKNESVFIEQEKLVPIGINKVDDTIVVSFTTTDNEIKEIALKKISIDEDLN